MNSEAVVVNSFFTVRVLLVGTILFVLPKISRKGLLFGNYIGEETAAGNAARDLLRRWNRGVLTVMLVSYAVGMGVSLSGWPVTGNFTGTAVLLLLAPLLYILAYRQAKRLAPAGAARQALRSAAPLSVSGQGGDRFAWLALALCVLSGVATIAYAALRYPELPAVVPSLARVFDINEEWAEKSVIVALYFPILNLVLSSFFALFALLILRAKQSLRGGTGGRSAEAQMAFRVTMSRVFSVSALATCLFFSVLSVQLTRISFAEIESIGPSLGGTAVVVVLAMAACLVRVMKGFGQGGALREEGSAEAPLTGALADNAHWLWGVIYIDRNDPSILVESRFGIGYTMNLGNRNAVLLLSIYLATLLGLAVLAVLAMLG